MKRVVIAAVFVAAVFGSGVRAKSTTVDYVWHSYRHGDLFAYGVEASETPCMDYFGIPDYGLGGSGLCVEDDAPVGGHSTIEILD